MGGEVGVGVRVGRSGIRVEVGVTCKVGALVAARTGGAGVNVAVNVGEDVERPEAGACGAELGWQATNSIRRNKQRVYRRGIGVNNGSVSGARVYQFQVNVSM